MIWIIRHVIYLKKKKEYDAKVAKALKIIHDRIGPKAYDHIKRYLKVSPPQLRNAFKRGYVESFENSSFMRPSGGVFEVKFAKTQKMKRRYLEVYLSSH